MENYGFAVMPAIAVICMLLSEGLKAFGINSKYIPLFCGILGGLLGVLGMNIIPEYPADDILTAIAIGIVSGLGATGAHQVIKQLSSRE